MILKRNGKQNKSGNSPFAVSVSNIHHICQKEVKHTALPLRFVAMYMCKVIWMSTY